MRAGADLRLLRAAVFAAASATLAAAGHISGGERGLPLWAVAAGALLTWAFAVPFAGRERRSWPGIALALALAQLLLHLFFCLAQHLGGSAAPPSAGHGSAELTELAGRLLCGGHAPVSPERATALLGDAGLLPHHPGGGAMAHAGGGLGDALTEALATLASWPMLLGHLLAALAAGWLLRQGEAALFSAVRVAACLAALPRWARRLLAALRALLRLPSLAAATPPAAPGRPRTRHHPTPATVGTVLPDAVVRRGPPGGARSFTLAA
ncbi:hypothetical protein FH609_021675 [Streptomyces sp. 3MP-14]|uniref:Integral membrane protein n=1 Tax=Streptomyces mimosae TaxID=2586635 RepID=A0A5N6A5Z2_9ACTN|nr:MULTISPECIES: hypothetical protein [Streptomyces]KAB8163403.1 hypothetical protein FH607_019090 [Streptomyces mimosae]KAB8174680.1 hypothetical protein FH609_021675 [Streptomyces sp. 3MP-14]